MVAAAFHGALDLFEGLTLFLILSWGVPKSEALDDRFFESQPFATPYPGTFLAEYLRMMSSVLMYGLLILIPGLIAYCLFIFVPYIVLFSRDYARGECFCAQILNPPRARTSRQDCFGVLRNLHFADDDRICTANLYATEVAAHFEFCLCY